MTAIKTIIWIGLGAFLGANCRYGVSLFSKRLLAPEVFPLAVFIVNMLGCLLIGIVAGYYRSKLLASPALHLLLITGFLGAFTTFSSFGLDLLQQLERGQLALAIGNAIVQVVLGVSLVYLGMTLVSR